MLQRWCCCCFKIKMFLWFFLKNWITLSEFGIDSLCQWLFVVTASRCWSMDSMIGSVCTQNRRRNSSKRWGLGLFTLCSVQELCWTQFAVWFSCLVPFGSGDLTSLGSLIIHKSRWWKWTFPQATLAPIYFASYIFYQPDDVLDPQCQGAIDRQAYLLWLTTIYYP